MVILYHLKDAGAMLFLSMSNTCVMFYVRNVL